MSNIAIYQWRHYLAYQLHASCFPAPLTLSIIHSDAAIVILTVHSSVHNVIEKNTVNTTMQVKQTRLKNEILTVQKKVHLRCYLLYNDWWEVVGVCILSVFLAFPACWETNDAIRWRNLFRSQLSQATPVTCSKWTSTARRYIISSVAKMVSDMTHINHMVELWSVDHWPDLLICYILCWWQCCYLNERRADTWMQALAKWNKTHNVRLLSSWSDCGDWYSNVLWWHITTVVALMLLCSVCHYYTLPAACGQHPVYV